MKNGCFICRFEEWSDSSVIHDALQCLVANSDDPCNPNTEKLADVFSEAAKGAAEQAADVCLEKLQDVEDMVKLSSSSFSPLEKREIRERRRGRRRHRHRHRHRYVKLLSIFTRNGAPRDSKKCAVTNHSAFFCKCTI